MNEQGAHYFTQQRAAPEGAAAPGEGAAAPYGDGAVRGGGGLKLRILSLHAAFFRYFLPRVFQKDAEVYRRGRLLITSSVAIFAICLFFGTMMLQMGHYPLHNLVVVFSGCGCAVANLYVLRQTRSVTLAGLLFCLEILIIIGFQAYNDLGLTDPVLLWYMLVPWLAALLVRPAFGFIAAGVVAAIICGFYILMLEGHAFPGYTPADHRWLFFVLQLCGMAFYIGFLGWTYEGQTLKNLRAANARLRRAHEALRRSNRRVESILESITDGFFATDPAGRFTYVNHRALRLLGVPRGELLGRSAWKILAGQTSGTCARPLRVPAGRGAPAETEVHYEPLDRWFDVRLYPFADGFSVYFSDATERKRYEQQLVEAKETAENLARLKSNFIASVSHEIRTPLSGIMGFADILTEELEGEHLEFARLVQQNARRLLETINSVLDLSRLESGLFAIAPEEIDVHAAAEEVVHLLRPLARQKGLHLRLERAACSPGATLDALCVHRVLNNLIGNAIKFTQEGGVTVTVSDEEEAVCFQIADTGIGISEEFRPHLFDEFRQESAGASRSHQGSGLGLAITSRLVASMQGTIDVDSTKGAGTTFAVHLPRRLPATSASETSASPQEVPS